MLVPIVIGLSVTAGLLLVVLLILLFVHLGRFGRAVGRLNRELVPLAEELRAEAEGLRERMDRLDEHAAGLREAVVRRGARRTPSRRR